MATSRFARGSSNDPSKIVDRAAFDDSDFVFVEKEFGGGISGDRVHEYVNDNDNYDDDNYDDDDDDDDSYDYCEDVCSVLSSNDDNEHISLLSDSIDGGETETTATTPPARLTDSILTVPSVLMKDLDEAHEAAKLTRITVGADLESADLETSCSSSNSDSNDDSNEGHETEKTDCGSSAASSFEPATKEKDSSVDNDAGSSPTPEPPANSENTNEDSSSLIVPAKPDALAAIPSASNRRIVVLSSGANNESTPPGTTPYLVFSNFPAQELLAGKNETGPGGAASGNNSTVASGGNNNKAVAMSRTSNKKRRKKLKILKKAQAAEKFQQQVALANLTLRAAAHGKSPKKTKKHQQLLQTPPRGASKKVANLAVSCVMKSMTSYREELSRQQQQSKHRPVAGLTVS